MVTGWYGQVVVFSSAGDEPDDLSSQEDRLEEMAASHPEIQWLGRRSGVYSAYVPLHPGGYQAGADTLRGLLDKLQEFLDPTDGDQPDTG